MRYAFLSSVSGQFGGPQVCARNMELMLARYANFSYQIVRSSFDEFLSSASGIIHVQSNAGLAKRVIRQKLPLILGPNMVWRSAPKEIIHYPHMKLGLVLRPDPMPRKLKPLWKIRYFPPFVDDKFFCPAKTRKDIDVLTVGKSFNYPEYTKNLIELRKGLAKRLRLKHKHLSKGYTHKNLRDALSRTKWFLFPSPRESGASTCHALLEASMMDVPFIGLNSVILERKEEYNSCRGIRVKTVQEMLSYLDVNLQNYKQFNAREWTKKKYSFRAAFERLSGILDEAESV